MAVVPSFASIPRSAAATISAANTNRDGTGTIVPVFSAGSAGSMVHTAYVKASSTTAAGTVVLFLNDGTTSWVWREIVVDAITPSATVASFEATLSLYDAADNPTPLQIGWSIHASTTIAQSFRVVITGADL